MTATNLLPSSALPRGVIVVQRLYSAPIEDLWSLWTTKAGFESWWGPDGFRVDVQVLEACLGGTLSYDMIAKAPEAIAAMKAMGLPVAHRTHGRFVEFRLHERLRLMHLVSLQSGSPSYEHIIEVDFRSAGDKVSMVVTIHPHPDAYQTRLAIEAFTSQMARLDRRF